MSVGTPQVILRHTLALYTCMEAICTAAPFLLQQPEQGTLQMVGARFTSEKKAAAHNAEQSPNGSVNPLPCAWKPSLPQWKIYSCNDATMIKVTTRQRFGSFDAVKDLNLQIHKG
jgi:hypothetical protein